MNITIVKHKVDLGLDEEGKNVTATPNDLREVWKGERFQIKSDKGKFRVVFVPWPFMEARPKDTVDTEEELTFERSGKFEFYCYLTPTGETSEHGYGKNGGGHGIVRP
jgi:hypothetical protein